MYKRTEFGWLNKLQDKVSEQAYFALRLSVEDGTVSCLLAAMHEASDDGKTFTVSDVKSVLMNPLKIDTYGWLDRPEKEMPELVHFGASILMGYNVLEVVNGRYAFSESYLEYLSSPAREHFLRAAATLHPR